MKVGLVLKIPNIHTISIFEKMRQNEGVGMHFYFWENLPQYRKKSEWNVPGNSRFLRKYNPFRLGGDLWHLLKNDVLIFQGFKSPFPLMLIFLIVARVVGKRILISSEGLKKSRKASFFDRFIVAILNTPRITHLSIGTGCADDYRKLGFNKWLYRKFCFHEEYQPLTDPVGKPDTEGLVNILAVGRLIERKNFRLIINSLGAYSGSREWMLTICGEGEQERELKELAISLGIASKVNFMGYCGGMELADIYGKSDVFLLTSLYDGWGVVVNQAIHYNLPTLVSTGVRSGKDFLVVEEFNGFIYDSEQDFKDKLFLLIENDRVRRDFSENSKYIKKLWALETVAHRLFEVLNNNRLDFQDGPLKIIN